MPLHRRVWCLTYILALAIPCRCYPSWAPCIVLWPARSGPRLPRHGRRTAGGGRSIRCVCRDPAGAFTRAIRWRCVPRARSDTDTGAARRDFVETAYDAGAPRAPRSRNAIASRWRRGRQRLCSWRSSPSAASEGASRPGGSTSAPGCAGVDGPARMADRDVERSRRSSAACTGSRLSGRPNTTCTTLDRRSDRPDAVAARRGLRSSPDRDGPTALVLIGRGQIEFHPAPDAEEGQVRIFCGQRRC